MRWIGHRRWSTRKSKRSGATVNPSMPSPSSGCTTWRRSTTGSSRRARRWRRTSWRRWTRTSCPRRRTSSGTSWTRRRFCVSGSNFAIKSKIEIFFLFIYEVELILINHIFLLKKKNIFKFNLLCIFEYVSQFVTFLNIFNINQSQLSSKNLIFGAKNVQTSHKFTMKNWHMLLKIFYRERYQPLILHFFN